MSHAEGRAARRGIILAGGSGTRLYPATRAVKAVTADLRRVRPSAHPTMGCGACYSLAMARPMAGRATYEDLSRVPDDLVAEIVDGELFTTPRPAIPHAYVSSRLTAEIDIPFSRGRGGPGGWWILIEPELHVGEDVVVPDVAGWRHASLPVIPDAAFLTTPPDWVCEVLSPSTERLDRARKLGVYARERVGFVWLINPRTRTLEVFRLAGAGWALVATYADADVVRAQPFEAIALELASLWLPEKPPA